MVASMRTHPGGVALFMLIGACSSSSHATPASTIKSKQACDGADAAGTKAGSCNQARSPSTGETPPLDAGRPPDVDRAPKESQMIDASAADPMVGPHDAGSTARGDARVESPTDPCAEDHGGCDTLVSCAEVNGKAACGTCPDGYRDTAGDGHTCTDIDECKEQSFDCQTNSTCQNTPGSYECPCDPGFHGDGHSQCLENVLCNASGSNCDPNATCKTISGTRYCVCAAGFRGDGNSCSDIDECSGGAVAACGMGATACTNTPGGYTCTCGTGYSGTGSTACADIDECRGGAVAACGTGATACDNTVGSYTCSCGEYNGTGTTVCWELNECDSTTSTVCTADYPCEDLVQGYTCRGQFVDWRPTYSASAFTANGDGTVTDTRSGLHWQQIVDTSAGTAATTQTREAAKAYCEALSLAGTGWRLPTKAELESIVDDTKFNPAIDTTAFPGTQSDFFWTASPIVGSASASWCIYFRDGSSGNGPYNVTYRVRCVR